MRNHAPVPADARRPKPGPPGAGYAAVLSAVVAALVAVVLPVVVSAPAHAQTSATPAAPRNPLGGVTWGIDPHDAVYRWYTDETGTRKELLGSIALQPRVWWFHDMTPTSEIAAKVRDYIAKSQAGDPDTLVQLAVFRLWPKSQLNPEAPWTRADRVDYRRWVDQLARGIGSARAAVIVEPDLAVSLKAWRPAVRLRLARYATKRLASLPRTTVYLDAGASDWLSVPQAVSMLRAAGIGYARGFSLGATHYTGTAAEVPYGTALVDALRRAGLGRKRFVIDTADNGRPFTYQQYYAKHPDGLFDNAEVCRTRTERRCVALGVPPTTKVWRAQRGMTTRLQRLARTHVDAYLWFSRPWLLHYPARYDLDRALGAARTSPY